jgi:hypothetical protein
MITVGLDIAEERKRIAEEKENNKIQAEKLRKRKEQSGKAFDAVTNAMIGKEICTQCGYQGRKKTHTKGSFIGEVALWIIGIALALFSFGITILIPICYSLWRLFSRFKGCPKCKGNMIRTDSPVGQQMLKNLSQ